MTKSFPYLAMDSAGKRTILCDYPVKMFDNTTKKETTKMKTMSASDAATYASLFVKNRAVANRFWAKCMGQDSSMDDETAEKLKGFLKSRLTAEDHEQVCSMLAGDIEAQDTEPPPPFRRMPDGRIVEPRTAEDSKADFHRRYPGLAAIRIDNSGIQPSRRPAAVSSAEAKSFAERYPGLAHIRQG